MAGGYQFAYLEPGRERIIAFDETLMWCKPAQGAIAPNVVSAWWRVLEVKGLDRQEFDRCDPQIR